MKIEVISKEPLICSVGFMAKDGNVPDQATLALSAVKGQLELGKVLERDNYGLYSDMQIDLEDELADYDALSPEITEDDQPETVVASLLMDRDDMLFLSSALSNVLYAEIHGYTGKTGEFLPANPAESAEIERMSQELQFLAFTGKLLTRH